MTTSDRRFGYIVAENDRVEFVRHFGLKGSGVPDDVPCWVTEELIEETIRVWQRFYEDPLTKDEALVFPLNGSELLEIVEGSQSDEEVRRAGESFKP